MATSKILTLHEKLKEKGILFEKGFEALEFSELEKRYGIAFPPDLREFLSYGMPISPNFPNWKTGEYLKGRRRITIAEIMAWPADGMCFDIEHSNFWMPEWVRNPLTWRTLFSWLAGW